jgi:hypothetical protein
MLSAKYNKHFLKVFILSQRKQFAVFTQRTSVFQVFAWHRVQQVRKVRPSQSTSKLIYRHPVIVELGNYPSAEDHVGEIFQ